MKKKSNKPTFIEYDNGKKIRLCQEKGCLNEGEYEAPKSPNSKEKYFFCLHHIKIYNKRWNYFAGKSQKQIYDFQKNDFFEGRPTRPFSYGYGSKIKFEFEYSLDQEKIKFKRKNKSFFRGKKNDSKVKNALKIFSLSDDFSEKILKKRYKELVKKYHPDLNRNFLNKDSKIKEINNAYNFLLQLAKDNHEIK
tara:strand:+ start:139 stop:717 length:579 start_codon:yes stop_codon:yes gene_type:complete